MSLELGVDLLIPVSGGLAKLVQGLQNATENGGIYSIDEVQRLIHVDLFYNITIQKSDLHVVIMWAD